MKINRQNYESYFLDYFEGTLSGEEIEMLVTFLEQNPDLENELFEYQSITLSNKNVTLKNRQLLNKEIEDYSAITDQNFDEFCIAHYEKSLNPTGETMLAEFLKSNQEKQKDFSTYGQVFLKPINSIVYPGKKRLKRIVLSPFVKFAYPIAASAAIILLAIIIYPYIKQTKSNEVQQIGKADVINIQRLNEKEKTASISIISPTNDSKSDKGSIPARNHRLMQAPRVKDSQEIIKVEYQNKEIAKLEHIIPLSSKRIENPIHDMNLPITIVSPAKTQAVQGKEYLTIEEFAVKQIEKNVLSRIPIESNKESLSWFTFAKLGIKGISKITGNEIKLEKRTNESGQIVALALESDKFGISRTLQK